MTISGVGMTAKMTAAGRALESRRPDRLFDDPLAQALAGEDGFRWMEELRPPGAPAENPSIGPRTWFFDQLITRAAGDGLRQVVLLAAGMDTRAFRLPLPADTIVYELDDQAVLADKQAILDREHAVPNSPRQPVAADLAGTQWPASLAAAGFNPAAPAVFAAEGLTVYLPEQAVALLLDQVAGIAAPGGWLGIDMASADYLANPAAAPYLGLAAARGARQQFGTNDPGGFLAAHGWQADIHDMFAVARSLGRWPPPGVPGDVADRAAAASRNWLISATRVPLPPRANVG
jgi:methyltransferase (TIGR00027 family)